MPTNTFDTPIGNNLTEITLSNTGTLVQRRIDLDAAYSAAGAAPAAFRGARKHTIAGAKTGPLTALYTNDAGDDPSVGPPYADTTARQCRYVMPATYGADAFDKKYIVIYDPDGDSLVYVSLLF